MKTAYRLATIVAGFSLASVIASTANAQEDIGCKETINLSSEIDFVIAMADFFKPNEVGTNYMSLIFSRESEFNPMESKCIDAYLQAASEFQFAVYSDFEDSTFHYLIVKKGEEPNLPEGAYYKFDAIRLY